MRLDEEGNEVPGTLFEYKKMCEAIGGPECPAVKLLEQKIQENDGKDDDVIVSDFQMRQLLMPLLVPEEAKSQE